MKQCYLLLGVISLFFASPSFSQTQAPSDSIKIAVYPKYNKVSRIHKALYGKNYRKLWAIPVNMKVFHLQTEQGGMKITDIGGGKQTKSLKLEDARGREWALRTVQKYPEKAMPKYLRKTIASDILQDEVTTSHPFAALTVPPMAEALGIPHSNPQIVYLPDDPALGEYRKEFADQVFLFEEEGPLDGAKTSKTEKVQEKLQEDNDNRANQKLLLRARMLDIIIGDWDRHGDQWHWIKSKDSIGDLFTPLPRDRDKVFYSTSGAFPFVTSIIKPQLQPYRGHIRFIEQWNLNNVYFDLYFLNSLSQADWVEQANYVKAHLTDEVINAGMKRLPADIYAAGAKQITRTVMARRNNIEDLALNYYRFLSINVDVPASDKKDQFTIDEHDDGTVTVTINKLTKEGIDHLTYQRTFDPKITNEVRLYGLGGKDVFIVKGSTPSAIKIRMIGGDDEDTFKVDSALHNRGALIVYDRSDQQNNLPAPSTARIHTSTDTSVNTYDKNAFKYDALLPVLSLGYNTEDGVRLIAGVSITKQGFRKFPYASKQDLQVGYTLSRQSFIFTYDGDFKGIIGDNSLSVSIISRGPKNVNSFFGYGNDTPFPNSGTHTFDHYRNRYDITFADIRLYHQYSKWQVNGGFIGQYYNSSAANNQDLFFGEYNQLHPEEHLFAHKAYAGLVVGAIYDTRDSKIYPTKGVMWKTDLSGLTSINLSDHTNGRLLSTFSFFLNPGQDSIFVIANRTGFGFFKGAGEFFQHMNLGGPLSLQGFHTSRFIGNTIAYNNFELRLRLGDVHAYLFPSTWGLIGFNDTGRVWLSGESSDTWHDTYGGGIYVMPFHAFMLQAVLGKSHDGTLLYFSSAFRF